MSNHSNERSQAFADYLLQLTGGEAPFFYDEPPRNSPNASELAKREQAYYQRVLKLWLQPDCPEGEIIRLQAAVSRCEAAITSDHEAIAEMLAFEKKYSPPADLPASAVVADHQKERVTFPEVFHNNPLTAHPSTAPFHRGRLAWLETVCGRLERQIPKSNFVMNAAARLATQKVFQSNHRVWVSKTFCPQYAAEVFPWFELTTRGHSAMPETSPQPKPVPASAPPVPFSPLGWHQCIPKESGVVSDQLPTSFVLGQQGGGPHLYGERGQIITQVDPGIRTKAFDSLSDEELRQAAHPSLNLSNAPTWDRAPSISLESDETPPPTPTTVDAPPPPEVLPSSPTSGLPKWAGIVNIHQKARQYHHTSVKPVEWSNLRTATAVARAAISRLCPATKALAEWKGIKQRWSKKYGLLDAVDNLAEFQRAVGKSHQKSGQQMEDDVITSLKEKFLLLFLCPQNQCLLTPDLRNKESLIRWFERCSSMELSPDEEAEVDKCLDALEDKPPRSPIVANTEWSVAQRKRFIRFRHFCTYVANKPFLVMIQGVKVMQEMTTRGELDAIIMDARGIGSIFLILEVKRSPSDIIFAWAQQEKFIDLVASCLNSEATDNPPLKAASAKEEDESPALVKETLTHPDVDVVGAQRKARREQKKKDKADRRAVKLERSTDLLFETRHACIGGLGQESVREWLKEGRSRWAFATSSVPTSPIHAKLGYIAQREFSHLLASRGWDAASVKSPVPWHAMKESAWRKITDELRFKWRKDVANAGGSQRLPTPQEFIDRLWSTTGFANLLLLDAECLSPLAPPVARKR